MEHSICRSEDQGARLGCWICLGWIAFWRTAFGARRAARHAQCATRYLRADELRRSWGDVMAGLAGLDAAEFDVVTEGALWAFEVFEAAAQAVACQAELG